MLKNCSVTPRRDTSVSYAKKGSLQAALNIQKMQYLVRFFFIIIDFVSFPRSSVSCHRRTAG